MDNDHQHAPQSSGQAQQEQEDPGFISDRLLHEISKAQESLLFVSSYHSASEDEDATSPLGQTTAQTHTDSSMSNNSTIETFSDEVNKSSRNTVKSPLKESLQQSSKAFSNRSPTSITATTTIDISTSTNIASTSEHSQSHEPHSASTTTSQLQSASEFSQQQEQSPPFLTPSSELVFASGFSRQQEQSPTFQTHSKRSLSPTPSKNTRNIRSKVNSSTTSAVTSHEPEETLLNKVQSIEFLSSKGDSSTSEPRKSQDATYTNSDLTILPTDTTIQMNESDPEKTALNLIKRPSNTKTRNSQDAPDIDSDFSDILADTTIQTKESDPEKKPLLASSALPVYSKLIVALEEARLSDCLTPTMARDLHNLTMTCKRTGNALIENKPLPPEDNVIIIIDDEEEDLPKKYGFSREIFDYRDNAPKPPLASIPSASEVPPQSETGAKQVGNSEGVKVTTDTPSHRLELEDEELEDQVHQTQNNIIARPTKDSTSTPTNSTDLQPSMDMNSLPQDLTTTQRVKEKSTEILEVEEEPHQNESSNLGQPVDNSNVDADPLVSKQSQPSMTESNDLDSQSIQSQKTKKKPNPIHSSPAKSQKTIDESTSIYSQSSPSQTLQTIEPSITIVVPPQSKNQAFKSRDLRPRRPTSPVVPNPRHPDTNKRPNPPPITYQGKGKKRCRGGAGEGKDEEPESNRDTRTDKRKTVDDGALANVKFFLGSDVTEKELTKLLLPYNTNQTSKAAKLFAWNALTNLLRLRREGEPLNQLFLDSIEGGIDSVTVKTKYNGQTWYNAIEETMPKLFNCHEGEPAYAEEFFNTLPLKNANFADKTPKGLSPIWNHTWKTMRMCIRPSPNRVSSFLKVLLDSVLLTGKAFLQAKPVSESEKKMTGVGAVCQAIKWLNSQKALRPKSSKAIHLLDPKNLSTVIDIGLIQQWEDIFIKVLDSYVVQYFEANYILNEEASPEDKALAIEFKKEWKGDNIKSPTLSHLTMFACCGIRGLICCSGDVNVTPAGQMLGFTVLCEWLVKQRPDFKLNEPIFKRTKNLCFDYLSYWFTEAGDLAEGGSLVFPKSSAFVGKDQVVKFSEAF
ncbi:hypothetical protein DFH28DRAFT_1079928 [Melampsora americana]|nr:hypothetical protein DFH28DRAFT_1079928 [Melampsora americana]